ncbi:MAG: ABC transporter ATP-binding protein [Actinomycetota bacterium]|nr:ABC transporter ATP-binding protein [Actinomycetota bacterium]
MADGVVAEVERPAAAAAAVASHRTEPLLAVEEVSVAFGGLRAVDRLSFEVDPGTIVGLIGPNGAGKSTALKIIGGEVRPTSGRVRFDGTDLVGTAPHEAARRGLVRTFQLGGEFGRLTVMENLLVAVPGMKGQSLLGALAGKRFWRASQDAEVRRARDILSGLQLRDKEDAYASDLSGGQRKLVEIARALMARPKMLLLDEPMAGVNRSLARRIEETLSSLRAEGIALLLVEHELGSVERLCERVVVMASGSKIAEGDMSEVRSRDDVLSAYLGRRR